MRLRKKYNNINNLEEAEQMMILSHLISDHQLWTRCLPILNEDTFTGDFANAFVSMFEYERSNHALPDKTVVLADSGVALEYVDVDQNTVGEISKRVEGYVRRKAAEEFLIEAAELIETSRDKNTMNALVKDMEKIASISVDQDLGYEALTDYEELLTVAEKSGAIETGFFLLDEVLGGGVSKPSYNLISAASGEGKSIGLQNIAVNNSRRGEHTVYISLELPEFMVERRILSMATDMNIRTILHERDELDKRIDDIIDHAGLIQIKRFPISGTSVADFKSYIDALESKTGIVWDRIVIDYPDLMRPVRSGIKQDNIHLWDKAIAEEIYEWAHDKNNPKIIWGASQQVKGAKDEKKARQSGVAGGNSKPNTADNLLIFKRGSGEHKDKTWCYIEKARNGGTGTIVPFMWNFESQRWSCDDDLRDLMNEVNERGEVPSDNSTGKAQVTLTPAQQLVQQAMENRNNGSSDLLAKMREHSNGNH